MRKNLKYIAAMMMLTVSLIFVFPVTVLANEEAAVAELSATGEITTDVNVRKGPGTSYEKIGTVREGDTVTVTGESHDGWYRIEFQGAEGFIYGQYVTLVSTEADPENAENAENAGEQQTDLDEPERDFPFDAGIFKTAAVVVIIAVIIVMIILTLKSMRHDDAAGEDGEDDEDAEIDDDEDDEDAEIDDEEDEEAEDSEEYEDDGKEDRAGGYEDGSDGGKKKKRPVVLREEDYQLHIDPKYFEDEPIPQPDCVTGYLLEKQREEEERKAKENQENSGELQQAMDKLRELQEEIEKLKKKRE